MTPQEFANRKETGQIPERANYSDGWESVDDSEFDVKPDDTKLWGANVRRVLEDVFQERERQYARYGTNYTLQDGTGPDEHWLRRCGFNLDLMNATEIESSFRRQYEGSSPRTWMQLVREEIAEAFKERDVQRLRAELIQVAALAVSWSEKLDAIGFVE